MCEPGYVFSGEALTCLPCPIGTKQDGQECKACEPGMLERGGLMSLARV